MDEDEHDEYLNAYRAELTEAVLVESSLSDGAVQVFTLRRPGRGGVGGVDLAFVGAEFKRTVVTTDFGLGVNGVVSVRGIGPAEFAAAASSDQLAGWFLERSWNRERAYDGLEALIGRLENARVAGIALDELRGTLDSLGEYTLNESDFRACMANAGVDASDVPGYGHNARDRALLRAIAERFAETYYPSDKSVRAESSIPTPGPLHGMR